MEKLPLEDQIFTLLKDKGSLHADLRKKTIEVFNQIKEVINKWLGELRPAIEKADDRIIIQYREKGAYEFELQLGDDVLIFFMHCNVFTFDPSHTLWKSSYLKEDPYRGHFGKIYCYNFLADSFKYSRGDDTGVLLARILINKDSHFMVEGKRQVGLSHNDFVHEELTEVKLKEIAMEVIHYALDNDLISRSFEEVQNITINQLNESNMSAAISTAKRLGFRFQANSDEPTG